MVCKCCSSKSKSDCNVEHVCEEMLNGNVCSNPRAIYGTNKISKRIRELMEANETLKNRIVQKASAKRCLAKPTFADGCIKQVKCNSILCNIVC